MLYSRVSPNMKRIWVIAYVHRRRTNSIIYLTRQSLSIKVRIRLLRVEYWQIMRSGQLYIYTTTEFVAGVSLLFAQNRENKFLKVPYDQFHTRPFPFVPPEKKKKIYSVLSTWTNDVWKRCYIFLFGKDLVFSYVNYWT